MFQKLNQNIILISAFLLLFFVFVFSTISYYKINRYVEKTAMEKQTLMMKNLQNDLNYWLEPKIDIISKLKKEIESSIIKDMPFWENTKEELLSSSNKYQNYDSPKNDIESLLKTAKNSIDSIQVYFGLNNGLMLFDDGRLQTKGYDPRVRKWYIDAIKANKTIVSDPFIGKSSNQLTIAITAPIIVKGKYIGVVAASFFVNNIYQKVKKTKIEGGYAFVVGTNGNIIIHPDKEIINKNLDEIPIKDNKLPQLIKEKKEGVYEYLYKGEDKIMSFSQLNNGWTIVLTTKKDYIFSFMNELINFFTILGGILTILIVIILTKVKKKNKTNIIE